MMVIENYHFWHKAFADPNPMRFMVEIGAEKIPDKASFDVIAFFYECVMNEQGLTVDDREFNFVVCAQIGMSGEVVCRQSAAWG
jgi:hypothetical protein